MTSSMQGALKCVSLTKQLLIIGQFSHIISLNIQESRKWHIANLQQEQREYVPLRQRKVKYPYKNMFQ